MSLEPLELKSRVADQVYEAIHDAIMRGDFQAGDPLQIRTLANELGTSVMPVRQALTRLEQIGLVETGPYRGAVVRGFTTAELENIYAVRKLLEVEAARLGVQGHTKGVLPTLEAHHADMVQRLAEHDFVGYLDSNDALLAELYAGANNPVLAELIDNLWKRGRHIKLVGVKNQALNGKVEPLLRFQRRLIEAVETNDQEAAAQTTVESLDMAFERIRGRPTEPLSDD